jgi:hypothetical protein
MQFGRAGFWVNKCRTSDQPRSALRQSDRGRTCRITRRTRWRPRQRPGFGSGSVGQKKWGRASGDPLRASGTGLRGAGASRAAISERSDRMNMPGRAGSRAEAGLPSRLRDVGKITHGHQTVHSGPQRCHWGGECGRRGGYWHLWEAPAAPGGYPWAECRARTQLSRVQEEIGARLRKGTRDCAGCERVTTGDDG